MRNLLPILWLALLAGLGMRGVVLDDARYAWGMFPYVLRFEVQYRWRLDDGRTLPFRPGKEIRRAKKVFLPGREHDSMYGLGAIRAELRGYGRQVVNDEARVPPGARALEIELRSRKHDTDERQTEILEVLVP